MSKLQLHEVECPMCGAHLRFTQAGELQTYANLDDWQYEPDDPELSDFAYCQLCGGEWYMQFEHFNSGYAFNLETRDV